MEDEIKDDAHISKEQEEADLDTAGEETVEEIKTRLAKAEELANNYKIRAEKAEKLAKSTKDQPVTQRAEVSTNDLYALIEAKVPQDDIEDVKEYAKLKGISLSEALKTSVVKAILNEKAEMRNVALASNVGNARRSGGKISDDALLENARKGIMPETDADIKRLLALRKK